MLLMSRHEEREAYGQPHRLPVARVWADCARSDGALRVPHALHISPVKAACDMVGEENHRFHGGGVPNVLLDGRRGDRG